MIRTWPVILAALLLSGCKGKEEAEKPPPAEVTGGKEEAELATIKLTPEAEKRLGIQLAAVEQRKVSRTRAFGGEIVVPAGHEARVTAPVAGTLIAPRSGVPAAGSTIEKGQVIFQLQPLERDLRAEAERDAVTAQAQLGAAQAKAQRAEQLLRDKAGSVRAVEEARAELARAEAEQRAAQARLNHLLSVEGGGLLMESPQRATLLELNAAAGQSVAAGSQLFTVGALDTVWVRVPVYVGELPQIDSQRPALVHEVGGSPGAKARTAQSVTAPPSADAGAATAMLYFQLANPKHELRPGQRVGVTLAMRGQEESLTVPWSAVVQDVHGGMWVYENTAPQTYVRRRVDVRYVSGALAVLVRGLPAGAKVVAVGAAELFGTEFGAIEEP